MRIPFLCLVRRGWPVILKKRRTKVGNFWLGGSNYPAGKGFCHVPRSYLRISSPPCTEKSEPCKHLQHANGAARGTHQEFQGILREQIDWGGAILNILFGFFAAQAMDSDDGGLGF